MAAYLLMFTSMYTSTSLSLSKAKVNLFNSPPKLTVLLYGVGHLCAGTNYWATGRINIQEWWLRFYSSSANERPDMSRTDRPTIIQRSVPHCMRWGANAPPSRGRPIFLRATKSWNTIDGLNKNRRYDPTLVFICLL